MLEPALGVCHAKEEVGVDDVRLRFSTTSEYIKTISRLFQPDGFETIVAASNSSISTVVQEIESHNTGPCPTRADIENRSSVDTVLFCQLSIRLLRSSNTAN